MSEHTLAHHDDHHVDMDVVDVFGFWIYILTDLILFATLFAGFAVLHDNTFGGPSIKDITNLPYVLGETLFLLASSVTYGFAMLASYRDQKNQVATWLIVTFFLGLSFVAMEINEFVHLFMEGHSWQVSGTLTSFFALVGTHGLHVSIGLLWMIVMIAQVFKFGLKKDITRRLMYLGLFWHFLDIVWIFVFTIVYLMGAV